MLATAGDCKAGGRTVHPVLAAIGIIVTNVTVVSVVYNENGSTFAAAEEL